MKRLASFLWPLLLSWMSGDLASANEDCLWYVDRNGTWHSGRDCPLLSFCCGNCYHRYCCLDTYRLFTERQQKHCMVMQMSPTMIAGIASSILLFIAIVATVLCCFMCSCCYLYQRRQQRRTPYEGPGQNIQMSGYPVDPSYAPQGKVPDYQYPGYPAGQYYQPPMAQPYPPVMPPHYPAAGPPFFQPPMDPAYAQAPPPYGQVHSGPP
ncbi:protein shisa-4 [Erpetoichthys calabaricus]|uniref:Shisa family member 4 n=1 Tax=Erpetoichthys calabaricus TaxID=27687 RepID=A0A8C4RYV3_ERPCA|nr:protein shisa-4 [Erpetoichthys calabaricus]